MSNFILKYLWVVWLSISLAMVGIVWHMWQFWVITVPVIFLVEISKTRR